MHGALPVPGHFTPGMPAVKHGSIFQVIGQFLVMDTEQLWSSSHQKVILNQVTRLRGPGRGEQGVRGWHQLLLICSYTRPIISMSSSPSTTNCSWFYIYLLYQCSSMRLITHVSSSVSRTHQPTDWEHGQESEAAAETLPLCVYAGHLVPVLKYNVIRQNWK